MEGTPGRQAPARGEPGNVATEQDPSASRVIQFPKVADPGPLGLAAFALTTFVLSFFNAELAPASGEVIVFPLALAYGGIAQLLAGMWEFRTGNTFGAVAFTSYGAFWLSFWAFGQFFLLGFGNRGGNADVIKIGGYVGLATAIVAWYASFAVVVNSTFGKTVMPVGPLGK